MVGEDEKSRTRRLEMKWITAVQSVARGMVFSSYNLDAYLDSLRRTIESAAG